MLLTACSGSSNKNEPTSGSEAQTSSSENQGSESQQANNYKVTWLNYDDTVLEVDESVVEGSMPSYDGATPTRPDNEHYSYIFAGWSPELTFVTSNQTYRATFSEERIQYTIDFDLDGGSSSSYEGPKSVTAFTKDVFFFDCIKDGFNFRGWSYLGQKIFDEKGNQLANPIMAKQMSFKALFSQTAKLNIFIENPDAGTVAGGGEFAYNTDVELTATANDGYTFVGWYVDSELIAVAENYRFKMWSQDVTIEARFINNFHKFHVYSNNVENGKVLLKSDVNVNYQEEYEEYRAYTSEVTVVSYSLNDTRFLGWFNEDGELVDTNAIYKFVMPDEDYELQAKWNYFKITYELNGGTNDVDNPTSYTVESSTITLKNPSKLGATFLGWSYKGQYITQIDPNWKENITLSAVWADIQYTLTVGRLNTYGTVSLLEGEGYAREVMKVKATPNTGSIFLGWFDSNDNKLSDAQTYSFQMPTNDYEIVAHFQTKANLGMEVYMNSGKTNFSYGLYPQTIETSSSIINKLNASTASENGYYYYRGVYYAKKVASSSKTVYSGTSIVSGKTYWFKCSQGSWRVLANSGKYYMAVATKIYDVQRFINNTTETGIYNNYETSSMREYLIGTFKNKMFVGGETALRNYSVANGAETTDATSNPYVCNNTSDKVFPLSYVDYRNTTYFTSADTESAATTRKCLATDWTDASYTSTNEENNYINYWTRSPYSGHKERSWFVSYTGALSKTSCLSNYGIRPAIYIYYS